MVRCTTRRPAWAACRPSSWQGRRNSGRGTQQAGARVKVHNLQASLGSLQTKLLAWEEELRQGCTAGRS